MKRTLTIVVGLILCACGADSPATPDADTCPAPLAECASGCTNTDVDVLNCGGCGIACDAGEVCLSGSCQATCPSSQVSCDGWCVDPNTDPDYCGAGADCATNPGTACGAGQVCNGSGSCALTCQASLTDCGGTCVNTNTDRANCGGCGAAFACGPGEVCNGSGSCELSCQTGLTDCAGTCVDTNTDRANCGGCGDTFACGSGEVCNGSGVCELSCQAGLTDCAGTCVNTNSDRANCGGCGAAFSCLAGEVCNGTGSCELSCQAGLTDCAGTCVNTNTDRAHCGGCGTPCGPGEVCNGAGSCQNSCQSGLVDCSGTCVDPAVDHNFCGVDASCNGGTVCVAGEFCSGGACVGTPDGLWSLDVGTHSTTYSSTLTRGYHFTAPVSFTIVGLKVPEDVGTGPQNIQVMRFTGPPAGTNHTTLFYASEVAHQPGLSNYLAVNIPITAGDIIGILGARGTATSNMENSYRATGDYATMIGGQPTSLRRLYYQANLAAAQAGTVTSVVGNIGRVHILYTVP